MKVAIIGGHISPALALLDYLPLDWEPIFIGRQYTLEGDAGISLEYQVIQKRNIPFFDLKTARLQRKLTTRTIPSLLKLPAGYYQALRLLRMQKPDIIVGFGGYLSLPVAFAAYALRIPVIIHEQTLSVGIANRIISRFAKYICISWASSARFFPSRKTILTGNLMRKSFLQALQTVKETSNTRFTLYITGGSAGAHPINQVIEQILPSLLEKYDVIHQTGDAQEFGDYDRLEALRLSFPENIRRRYILSKFIDPSEVVQTYTKADLVISRSGINTVTELLLMHKPSLLIPLPHGQKYEQMTNAIFLREAGLAKLLPQNFTTPDFLLQTIEEMEKNVTSYQIKQSIDIHLHLHAAQTVIQLISSAYEEKHRQKP